MKSGKRYWSDHTPVAGQQFEYGFDDIGNRTTTKAGGDSAGANLRTATYTANSLNQYSQRTVPGAFDVLGIANAAASVAVNGSGSDYRRGEYFQESVSVSNSSAAVWQSVSVIASNGGSSTTNSGNVFVPKTAETVTYDLDGNTTQDGHWDYVWDAENRLTTIKTRSGIAGLVRRLELEYDCQGRRIRKRVYDALSGGNLLLERRFLYDGWNVVAELNGSNGQVRTYLWGADLSGSLQGAGGVGGLVLVNSYNDGVHFPAYDGNGNVTALVKATDGTASATYEYGPFGETIRANGLMSKLNPFRFSSKYTDDETDFLYYGYRYYNPSTGRWLNRDPIEEAGGINLFAFVHNEPIRSFDLLGRAAAMIQCDGNGDYEVDIGPFRGHPAEECVRKHEEQHIKDFKQRYGADSCKGRSKGVQPSHELPPPHKSYSDFLYQSECSAYIIEYECEKKLLKACDKDDRSSIRRLLKDTKDKMDDNCRLAKNPPRVPPGFVPMPPFPPDGLDPVVGPRRCSSE